MGRFGWILIVLACVARSQGEEPPEPPAAGSVVEGTVFAPQTGPLPGARVFVGPAGQGLRFLPATSTTDASGRYRIDLAGVPGAVGALKAYLLAPGFKVAERAIVAVPGVTTADFVLEAQPWKETRLRLEDEAGHPVEGVEVACSVGMQPWEKPRTDARGHCRVAMAPGMPVGLDIRPPGARAIHTMLVGAEDEPASIPVPVLSPIRGRVLDAEGRPAAGVNVGDLIQFGPEGRGQMARHSGETITTDREGRFAFVPSVYASSAVELATSKLPRPRTLCFADHGFELRAYRTYDEFRNIAPMDVTLAPTRRVRIPIAPGSVIARAEDRLSSLISPAPGAGRDHLALIVHFQVPSAPAGSWLVEDDLPAGTYRLKVELYEPMPGERVGTATRELVVPKGDGPLDLPPLELELTASHKMVGKPAPEIEATEIDTGRPVRLADFRGKVVVLDFWGYWCGQCNISMPHLADLHRNFEGRPLEVVALHDQSIQSRADFNQKTAVTRERLWGGRDLPFRVLFDGRDPKHPEEDGRGATGATIERYGVRGFPSVYVIDADGTMVGQVPFWDHDRLEAVVREQVEKAEGR